ncbi:MAG: COQ9 family protein, partial [Alphaproteobacteria bacterium]
GRGAESHEDIRDRLLQATLPHVPFDGWSARALTAGASDEGIDSVVAQNAFPGGGSELIRFFSTEIDRRMMENLGEQDLAAMKVRDRIALAVRTRLELLIPHREAVRRGVAFLALPRHAALGLKCLYRTVDTIWYAAGDTATDYNFYSKRLLLAGVYSTSLLFWLNDSSDEFAATWAFLDRRIAEVFKVGGALGRTMTSLLNLPDRLFASSSSWRRS